jgi:hypothetical protein
LLAAPIAEGAGELDADDIDDYARHGELNPLLLILQSVSAFRILLFAPSQISTVVKILQL